MATKLASGYIDLTVKYASAMKQINDDFTKVAGVAGKAGSKAGKEFSQGVSKSASDGSKTLSKIFDKTGAQAAAAGKSGGGTFGKGFLGGLAGAISISAISSIMQPVVDATVSAFKEIISTGVSFEKQMNALQGVTRATGDQMAVMRQHARDLGSDTKLAGTSAADAATAMLELVKGGLSMQDAMDGARGVLQLATAGQISAAEAAENVANALAMWQRPGTDAVHVADMLANAATASSGEVGDYAQALAQAGSVASGFGVSMEDTVTSLALFAKFGIKGSDAGTLMKTSLQAITDQGNPAQGAIEALNLELYRGGKFVGYPEMLKQVAKASEHMSQESFQAATNILFGSDAMRSSMVAANGGSAAFDDMRTAVTRAGGASELAAAQMQGMPGAIEAISNTLEGIKLDAFAIIGPSLTTGLQAFGDWMSTHKPEIIAFFTDVAATAVWMGQQVGDTLGNMIVALGEMIGAAGDVSGTFLQIRAAWERLFGNEDRAKELEAQAEPMFNWGEELKDAGRKVIDFTKKGDQLQDTIRDMGDKATKAAQFTEDLGTAVTLLPDGKTITLKDNTPEAIAKIDKTKYKIENLPDGTVKIIPLTDEAAAEMDAFIAQQTGRPINVDMMIGQAIYTGGPVQVPAELFGPGLNAPAPPSKPGGTIIGPAFGATGGTVRGPGTATSDSIPAMLSAGEGIVNARAMTRGGAAIVAALNTGRLRRFAKGGELSSVATAGGSASGVVAGRLAVQQLAAEKLLETMKEVISKMGELADIAIGGVKETLLPPGFSDPTEWGAFKAGAGILGFASTLTNDPMAKGLLQMGAAGMGGSGGGMAGAIQTMITPRPTAPGGAAAGAMSPWSASSTASPAGWSGGGTAVDNSVHIAQGGQVNADAKQIATQAYRQQRSNQMPQLGTRRWGGYG